MKEGPDNEKLSHSSVGYMHPAKSPSEECGRCIYFIPGSPPSCKLVASPIQKNGWCKRFKRKVKTWLSGYREQ